MRRVLSALLIGVLSVSPAAVSAQDVTLRASVDRGTVRENESFTYVLRAEGQVRAQPDLQPLAGDFRILQSSRNTSIQMAGGRTTTVTEWRLQLMPTAPGRFTLPPIAFAGALSNPVEVEVLPAAAGDAPADIFLEVEVTPETAYAQAEIIFTVRLFRGVSTGRSSLSAPAVDGGEVIVERLGDDREYQVVRDGRNFMALERRYAMFPQTAGSYRIEPMTLDAVVITASGFRGMQVFSSEAVEFEVSSPVPPPPRWAGAAWLPARSLELGERWSADPDTLTAGVPQTRTLVLEAEGVQPSQLPELTVTPVDGVRQYPDQPELESEITPDGLRARRTERYAVIAQAEGERMLAGVEMPWFDVAEARWKAATLAPRRIEVLPGAEPPSPAAVAAPPAPEPAADTAPGAALWRAVSAGLLVVWLATLGLWWQSRRPPRRRRPKLSEQAPRRAANRRLLRELRAACKRDDARRAHALLLEWAALRLPGEPPSSLGAMADRLPDDLASAVAELERALYGPDREAWEGGRLAAALADVDSVGRQPKRSGDALLPLYR